ncbi:MAG: Ig-like domain-containing protein [Bacteroidales bacterium]|jgi:hypothetical protein|nr:Ig-like domain-containing protein [Bacteroidales bacterium]
MNKISAIGFSCFPEESRTRNEKTLAATAGNQHHSSGSHQIHTEKFNIQRIKRYLFVCFLFSYLTAFSLSGCGKDNIPEAYKAQVIHVNKTSLTLKVGEREQLSAFVVPAVAHPPALQWSSADESVATVDNGWVEAAAAGETTVTASYADVSASVSVAVEAMDEFGIRNDHLRLIQDTTRGGAISCIAKANDNRNLVNIFDEGRYIQQSYYAGRSIDRKAEGQSPAWSPWSWNPIQCGDYAGNRAKILETRQTANHTYVKCIPMLWDMNGKYAEAEMEQWTSLDGNAVTVRCRLTCRRTDNIYGEGIANNQEIPAVYPISALNKLYAYFGNAPFTNALLTRVDVVQLESGFWGTYAPDNGQFPSEKWMAFVDDNDWGIGIYSPQATLFLAGRAGEQGKEATSSSTSYIAPLRVEALMKNAVSEYTYYLVVGTLSEIRAKIYEIRENNM